MEKLKDTDFLEAGVVKHTMTASFDTLVDGSYYTQVDLPGCWTQTVKLDGNVVVVEGVRVGITTAAGKKPDIKTVVKLELPSDADFDNGAATSSNGVTSISIPKRKSGLRELKVL